MVKIINETIQEYKGERYYLCGAYFQKNGVRLHRLIWQDGNKAEIPKGMHIHHKDGDRANNSLNNLQLITASEHARIHGQNPSDKAVEARRRNAQIATEGNKRIPKKVRSETRREAWEKQKQKPPTEKQCGYCGEVYETYVPHCSKFCSNRCKAANSRRK